MPTIAIVGASANRAKFGNKAVRAYVSRGFTVYPVNPHETSVEGLPAYPTLADVPPPIDMVSFYVPPHIGITLLEGVRDCGARELWLNLGSEDRALLARAEALGLKPVVACSIIAVGESPHRY